MGILRQLYSPDHASSPQLDLIFKEYYNRLVFFAWQILKNKEQSEDIVQEAFVQYWQRYTEVSSHPVAVKNFLYRSVKNASLNAVRHTEVVDQFKNSQPSLEPSEEYILESIISAEIIAEIHVAINSLPSHLIQLTRLSFLEGKKNHEIAQELNMSVNTVKKQKQRVMELLKLKLNPKAIALLIGFAAHFRSN